MTTHEVLILCYGNICRSPMAEALLRRELEASGATHLRVSSAGFWRDGVPVDPHSVAAMARRGLDVSGHLSRALTPAWAPGVPLALAMAERLAARARDLGCPAAYNLAPYATLGRDRADIADPVGQGPEVFEACAVRLEGLIPAAADRVLLELPA